jgi:hypothetical protein
MEDEMILFFPDGLQVMIIDDDAKAVRRATAMLSELHYAGRLILDDIWWPPCTIDR